MKGLLCFGFLLVSYLGVGQVVDTVSVEKTLDTLKQAANELLNNGKYGEGVAIAQNAADFARKNLGENHLAYAGTVILVAVFYSNMGKPDRALPLFLEAKEIRGKILGKEHSDYISCLINLGNCYKTLNEFEMAEGFYLEAKMLQEKVLGKHHPYYAALLNGLANLEFDMGRYEKSAFYCLEIKKIQESDFGANFYKPQYAKTLNTLANIYIQLGQYEKAELLHLKAQEIWRKLYGVESRYYSMCLNNMASLYRLMGFYEKSKYLLLESLPIQEKVLGKEHPEYHITLNNLGVNYYMVEDFHNAEILYLEAKDIQEKLLGKEHLGYATSLNLLGRLYLELGQYAKSEQFLMESKSIREKILGQDDSGYAWILNNLAYLYFTMGEYNKSEDFYLKSKSIREKIIDKTHPDYIQSLLNLAVLYQAKSDYERANQYYLLSNINSISLLRKFTGCLSEKETIQFNSKFQNHFDNLFSFAQIHPTDSILYVAYDNTLFLNTARLRSATALNLGVFHVDSATQETYREWKSLNFRLSKQYIQPILLQDSSLISRLEGDVNQLEKKLIRAVPAFAETQHQIHWHDVHAALQSNQAAIEIIHYRYYDKKVTDSIMYAALLLLPNDTSPHFIPLCEERQLDALIYKPNGTRANYLQNLYSSPRIDGLASLYQLVWAPIDKVLKDNGVKTVYYAPSGLLHRLNLSAIAPDKSGQTLADQYHLIPVASTRQLVTDHSTTSLPTSAIIYGGVRYEMDSTAIARANRDLSATAQDTTGGLFRYANRGAERADNWDTLAGTRREALYLYQLLSKRGIGATLRMNYEATEESFKQIGQQSPSPSLLHVGTHGFFFPDPKDTTRRRANFGDDAPVFKISEHPLIRSGLKLAGSKYAWENKRPMGGMEDGILTAYEVSQMNLSNTQLVVLSACETGLGDIKGNEGVYGLQRAFRIAGAKNVLMSLWKVPDEATEKLMTQFYKNWLEQKMPLRVAFESAQKWLRGQKGYENPYFWAGFVLIGEL